MSDCFKQILDKYKRAPDIVVNSAGITKDGFLLRMKEEDFEQVMLVNRLREEIHTLHLAWSLHGLLL